MSNPLRDMEKVDVIFCIGTNMAECHPVAYTRIKKAIAKGAKMIVADPRRIRLAEDAHLYLPLRVGTDTALLTAMAHVIVRDGLIDEEFIAERTEGYEAMAEHVKQFTPEWAEAITGVPAADIERAAQMYGESERGSIYYTLGITEHSCGVDNVKSLCNLALITGHIGKEGCGINPMRGQNNVQGAGDCGAIPNNYVGFQASDDPANQAKFEKAYGRSIDLCKGPTKVDALDNCGKGIHAMLIDGENSAISDPNGKHCRHALEALDHMVVIDIFPNDTTELAHVVLPASSWAETEGTTTNTERRVQRMRQAVSPPGEAKPDWWILSEIAKRLGFQGFEYESAKDVFEEICELSPIYAGLNWERVETGNYHWPVPHDGHPGTPRLHEGEFHNGRGKISVVSYRESAEVICDEYPVWLTTGRRLEAYHTRTQTGRSDGINDILPEELLEVSPSDAKAWEMKDGDFVNVSSPRGQVTMKVKVTDRSPPGTVFCSFSFSKVPVNDLTGGGYDPVTQTAELKICPVKVELCAAPAGIA